ncbi:adenylate/guanylate cyclase domain-containing protein [Leptospira stimsonii]|uniref:Adenylate/guanylate cyclase domain-containing protein n=1 Tax=Leptospira stimsonii TaxID=2202203 RepID=A0ABY2N489_9LEPT|nr:adenylate/guanylate cyclase domain-containing protein [Leptospira stimsonii]TGM16476.1 adenylate/guanylate cyclase domain-containing protein [Leptospira stimsonii]
MVVFGAPLSGGSKEVKNAIDASIEILRKIEFLNLEGNIPETKIGIESCSGDTMTGIVDSVTRKEYTIIGYVVNSASKVEQLNQQFCTKLLVTQSVYEDIKDKIRGRHSSPI